MADLNSSPEEQRIMISRLAKLPDRRSRRDLIRRNPALRTPEFVTRLYDSVVELIRVDLIQAERISQLADWLAGLLKDDYSRAQAARALGHVLYARARYAAALERYETALQLLESLGADLDVARTLSGALHSLMYLGRYEKALSWARRARRIFGKHRDSLRLARLDLNIANIFYRQDRFSEALSIYKRAYPELVAAGEPRDVAAVISNLAVCYISLNDFGEALRMYEHARTFCERHHMPLLVAGADYNIAYLHYLRGEYTRAIALYRDARLHCHNSGDNHREALCDLDESEMDLELNLIDQGALLAQRALRSFQRLGTPYEIAKALTNLGVVANHRGRRAEALDLFDRARAVFLREHNAVWPALIDVYKALVLYKAGEYRSAAKLCKSALRVFTRSKLVTKAVLCHLLVARLEFESNRLDLARKNCLAALTQLETIDGPALSYQAWLLLGELEEASGRTKAALQAYRRTQARLETLRTNLGSEELKIAFFKDKLAVYESLVWLFLSGGPIDPREAFTYIEQAKSRSLVDRIAFAAQLPPPKAVDGALLERFREIRANLTACYRQLESAGLSAGRPPVRQMHALQRRVRTERQKLTEALEDVRGASEEFASVQAIASIDLERIRSVLPADSVILEYFFARGRACVCLIDRNSLHIAPLCDVERLRRMFDLLQFQLSKFNLAPDYVEMFRKSLLSAARGHLAELHAELIAPIRCKLHANRLIIVPHGFLHGLPFHALLDGARFLIDDFSISYAPSASVFYLSAIKPSAFSETSLVLGVSDPATPLVKKEVQAVARVLPGARLFLDGDATEERLREYCGASRFVHIATHGLFREDNPMLSAIPLAGSDLTLFDLYHLRLSAELVTLSGCGTGLSVVIGADEIVGLVRGLLYAGAHSVLVSLWNVNDQSTSEFMETFYARLQNTPHDRAGAVRHAMIHLRERYEHPFYWAPFMLVGSAGSPRP